MAGGGDRRNHTGHTAADDAQLGLIGVCHKGFDLGTMKHHNGFLLIQWGSER